MATSTITLSIYGIRLAKAIGLVFAWFGASQAAVIAAAMFPVVIRIRIYGRSTWAWLWLKRHEWVGA